MSVDPYVAGLEVEENVEGATLADVPLTVTREPQQATTPADDDEA